jgi:polar amino acid transport system substrate-binding protein
VFPVSLQASQCQSIKVNGPNGWEPISYRNTDDQLTGIAIEVAQEVFNTLQVKLEILDHLPWKRQQLWLENGTLDLIVAAYFNDERAKKFTYSDSYHSDDIAVFVRKNKAFKYKGLHSLKGKIGLRPLGGTYGNHFDQFAEQHLNIVEYSNHESSMKRIHKGNEDYLVLALMDGLFSAYKYGLSSEITPIAKGIAQLPIHFLMSKKSPCVKLMTKINQVLKKLESSHFTKRLEEKYLNKLRS